MIKFNTYPIYIHLKKDAPWTKQDPQTLYLDMNVPSKLKHRSHQFDLSQRWFSEISDQSHCFCYTTVGLIIRPNFPCWILFNESDLWESPCIIRGNALVIVFPINWLPMQTLTPVTVLCYWLAKYVSLSFASHKAKLAHRDLWPSGFSQTHHPFAKHRSVLRVAEWVRETDRQTETTEWLIAGVSHDVEVTTAQPLY